MPLSSLEGALFAEFDRADDATLAMTELKARGYARIESYSPFPLSSEQAQRRNSWTTLGIIVFAIAAVGALAGYLVQWYANVHSYPLNIGGRPTHAALSFVYPTFEAVILFAGLTTFLGPLIALRLPRLWRAELEIEPFERTSDDRYWITVSLGTGGGDLDRTTRELRALRAKRVVHALVEP